MNMLRLDRDKIALLTLCALAATTARGLAVAAFPTYPGAMKVSTHARPAFSMCGRHLAIVSYHSNADANTVAHWYGRALPGAVVIDDSKKDEMTIDSEFEIVSPDASQIVVVHRIFMRNPKLQAAAKQIDADKTEIGIETFTPALGPDYGSLVKAAKAGSASAKTALTVKCPNG